MAVGSHLGFEKMRFVTISYWVRQILRIGSAAVELGQFYQLKYGGLPSRVSENVISNVANSSAYMLMIV